MNLKSITNNSIVRATLGTVTILMVPFLGKWPWSPSDFIVMGTMIFITGLMLNLTSKKMGKYKVTAIIVIILMFLWLWAELAVGVFTNWGS